MSARADHLRPQRWNWTMLVRPLDRSLERQAQDVAPGVMVRNLRYFYLDGLFASVSENFYLGYVALFALAYGANNSEVGALAAVANLLGAAALFPGAKLVEMVGRRKPVVIWSGGILARVMLLGLFLVPFLISNAVVAIAAIILLDGLRAFFSNLANPGWTSMVADLVPQGMRARFFSSRNIAMGVAALLIAPLAGQLIKGTNARLDSTLAGYQATFLLAFLSGMVSTAIFSRIKEPPATDETAVHHHRGDLRRALHHNPAFVGLVISAFIWNLSLQIAAPFFNVYLVTAFAATTTTIGVLSGIASLSAIFGQRYFAKAIDSRGSLWVQAASGLIIPLAPLAWAFVTAPWQVGIINAAVGFLWAGYNLANFNILLELAPDEQRARAVALFQMAVFGSAVAGPLIGGALADIAGYKLIFVLSFIGRYIGVGLFIWLTLRPRRRDTEGAEETKRGTEGI
jgi:MFS family permease